ncbi:MAG: hypothetical protein ACYC6N_20030 [Pirellulaceae bacterium]
MDASIFCRRVVGIICLLAVAPVMGRAQEPKTLWTFLGIPQAYHHVHGALANRTGQHPGLEKKPSLKGLAHPANLASEVPVLKKAAEVKQAEDLKKQKIKAIRYLTEIGCGCYDTDGSITEALLAASDDCTEEVRLATVQAIAQAASGVCCSNCGQTCCCNKKVLLRLAEMAYERDDTGCFKEPSSRVREAAATALQICCPGTGPVVIEQPDQQPQRGPERESVDESTSPDDNDQDDPPPVPDAGASRQAATTSQFVRVTVSDSSDDLSPLAVESDTPYQGVIVHADAKHRLAHIHLDSATAEVPVGTRLSVYRGESGGGQSLGALVVVQTFPGSANVRPVNETQMARFLPGSIVRSGDSSQVARRSK